MNHYSHRRFNIKGRVCLGNSLLFGVMGIGVTYFLHPLVRGLIERIPSDWLRLVATLVVAVFVFDLLHTLVNITRLKERIAGLRDFLNTLDSYNKAHDWYDKKDIPGSFAQLRKMLSDDTENPSAPELLGQLNDLDKWWTGVVTARQTKASRRILRAFPTLKVRDWQQEVEILRENWQGRGDGFFQRLSSLCREIWKGIRADIKLAYRDISASRLVWVFFIGCLIGYVVETLFCLVTTGSIESRQGMVYGPFSQVYGMGAVLLLLALTPLSKKNNAWLFFGSAIVGGLFEALCSVVQEAVFGTVSWHYESQHIALFGGRTSVMYMLFWGILGVLYMRGIYPPIGRLFDRLARRQQRFFAAVVAIVLGLDLLLSGLAVTRWVERDKGQPPSSSIGRLMDEHFPDERMKEIYPNMIFTSAEKK